MSFSVYRDKVQHDITTSWVGHVKGAPIRTDVWPDNITAGVPNDGEAETYLQSL